MPVPPASLDVATPRGCALPDGCYLPVLHVQHRAASAFGELLLVGNWEQLATQAHYRASRLAWLCHVSPKTLQRFFSECMRTSPQRWLNELRRVEAERLALQGLSTKEIATLLGYNHSSNLCRAFRRSRGLTIGCFRPRPPSEFPKGVCPVC